MDESVTKDLMDFDRAMEMAEKAETNHKHAFREAFEFLKAFFPPRWDEDYWTKAAEDILKRYETDPDNPLMMPMLCWMMDYLNDVCKTMPRPGEVTA